MRLLSIEILPSGPNGWFLNRLEFGQRVTQLFAANGSGKTPLVKSIAFALGAKVEFRQDVKDRCEKVLLEVESGDQKIILERAYKRPGDISARLDDGSRIEFGSERDYSRFLFFHWGFQDPVLTSIKNEKAQLYSSQILPLYYLDQGYGYTSDYYSTQKFIRDQYVEAMRLVFGLAPKNPYDRRRARIELKDKEQYLDRAVARSERLIEELTQDLGGPRRNLAELNEELKVAMDGLDELRRSGASADRINLEIDSRLAGLHKEERRLLLERAELYARVRSYSQIRKEIEIEANTLSLNEEARRVFSSFEAICSNEGCSLFLRSHENYGKSLLYLRDQLKDLNRVSRSMEGAIADTSERLDKLKLEIGRLKVLQSKVTASPDSESIVDVAAQLTEKMIRIKKAIQVEGELSRQESHYLSRLEERAQVQSNLAGLNNHSTGSSVELLTLRNALKERIAYWLNVLRTKNVDRDVEVGPDFDVFFGGEKSTSIDSSSTQTRVVLAVRTAAFELALQRNQAAPRFLILDTPRQQDIAREDLAEYIKHAKDMAGRHNAQIIYSTTNQRYELETGDVEWVPMHPGNDQKMYLGSLE